MLSVYCLNTIAVTLILEACKKKCIIHVATCCQVDYIYSAEVDVTENNVQMLLTAANLLQLDDVRDGCCDFLQSQLHPTNCLGIKTFADIHGCADLRAQVRGKKLT